MAGKKTCVYCNVLPANYKTPFLYICDFDVKPGDIVVISIRNDSNFKAGLVLDVNEYTEENVPYPLEWTKHILRHFGDNESAELVKQKASVEAEKAIRFKSNEQKEKLSTKEALSKHGVGRQKIHESKKKIKAMLESISDGNEKIDKIITSVFDGIKLTRDGMIVTGYDWESAKNKKDVRIPLGVRVITDNAFLHAAMESLFIPKELKQIGKYTLTDRNGIPNNIRYIEIEDGNEYFYTDGIGFYSITDGKKKLEYLIDTTITKYIAPNDVVAFAAGVFSKAWELRKIILSESIEEFDVNVFLYDTKVEEIYIPKTLKKLNLNRTDYWSEIGNRVFYKISEEHDHLFRDEDSIYEVLEDGTYKLLKNLYTGKGKVHILEGTSVISEDAFAGYKNFTEIDFPKSLRVIEKCAFAGTLLKKLIIPNHVVSIGEQAFSMCDELKDVTLSPELETIASDAFSKCWHLEKIKTDGKKKAFTYTGGVVTKLGNTSHKDDEDTEKVDYFSKFAKEAVETIREESIWWKENINDSANYDETNRVVSITTAFKQASENLELVKERIACAEELKVGDAINIKLNGEAWEVTSKTGKSLGQLSDSLAKKSIPYLNFITVTEAIIDSIIPKSKRRANTKYAIGSVKFELKERTTKNLSEQDLITRTQFTYTITDTEAILVKWIGNDSIKKAIIPSSIEGKTVKTVPSGLFEPYEWSGIEKYLEEIVFSEGIEKIETGVLFLMKNMKKVVFPKSVRYISPDVFADGEGEYRDLYLHNETVYIAPKGSYAEKFLKEYKPDSYDLDVLTVLNDDSKESIDNVKMFKFEAGNDGMIAKFANRWGLKEFENNNSYNNILVPSEINGESIKTFDLIGIPPFVKKLIIPAAITEILNIESAALSCYDDMELCEIEIAEDNPMYWSDGYSIFTKDRKTLLRLMAFKLEEYTIPEGTKTIGMLAFGGMTNLTKLVLPKSIKKIASHAFYDCEKLADISGIEGVTEVGNNIFAREGYRSGISDFSGSSIPYERDNEVLIIGSILIKYNDLSNKVIRIPEGITKIGDSAFGWYNENDNVEEIILPSTVSVIEKGAFRGRNKLKKIKIPEGVKEIPEDVFKYCEQLEVINIPASVEKIEINAFPACYAVMSYSNGQPCALKAIEVDAQNKHYCSIDGMLLTKDKTELLFIPNAIQTDELNIPDGVKKIDSYAAINNKTVSELIIPNSVIEIKESAFEHCENLEKVVLPEGLKIIGKHAFANCKKLKTIVWPRTLKTIGDCAFEGCELTEVLLPENVEHIGVEAFAMNLINKVTLPKSVRTLGWGAFSRVPEIEVYDSIDPEAGDASAGIDTCNGRPNSLVGYIGMGPAWAMWECAANHRWVNYTIVVRSAETDEIKYKVWMGADDSQRDYYCFLSSAWGHNATFAFEQLDEFFSRIRGKENKLKVARYRLEYPYELTDAAKTKYEEYIKKNS